MRQWLGPFLPAEHGAWGVWFSSLLLGVLAVGFHIVATPSILLASLGLLLLRNPVLRWMRSGPLRSPGTSLRTFPWAGWIFCVTLIGLGAIPLLWLQRWFLCVPALIAGVALVVEARSRKSDPRSRMVTEVLNSLAVSSVAPATAYAASGTLGWIELTLWVLCALYFGVTTLDVRWRVLRLYQNQSLAPAERVEQAGRERFVAAGIGIAVALLYGIWAPVSGALFLSFVPRALRFFRAVGPGQVLPRGIRRLGWQEVMHSLLFVVMSAALIRWS